ncbi:MAG: CusA/CzcA family heavy metal efflux RND transporter [Hyphomicrobium sp.]|jgi:HME family heavy-metal exporter|uniref:efflux RND transporter permease subunit n=1 Tax=Hyphomicrobium sp. TaxID=82 RepID=UPI0025C11552|nr:efflux RND transporter permease subunit [Hyphomicrobium sp.]MBX9863526.1 CusA/CzcA family heavy metal efflux RND transporter [Hyphomicrobium sp.]
MFNAIVRASLSNRLLVLAAAIAMSVYGLLALGRLPVDVFPDLNRPTVTLMTEVQGFAPEEVEQLVTFPIETAMNGMAGVSRVRSVSSVGLSIVYVEFDWSTEIYLARQQVSERLQLVREQMPPNVIAQMGPISSVMGEIMLIAMSSEKVDPMALRELADFTVRPQILTVSGVSQVIPIGGEVRQYRVVPDPRRMAGLDISFDAIQEAIKAFGVNTGGGFVDQRTREFLIRNIARSTRIEDLRNLVVTYRSGQPVTLSQVATVDFAARAKRGDAGYKGKPAVILGVQKQPGADTVSITREIERILPEIQRVMPEGVSVTDIQFRQATFIEASINNVQRVLVEALIVVAVVLFAFLLNWQTTFISLLAIPFSVLTTIIVFEAMGLSINTMTLGGLAIAIGALVDDAVVDVENIYRRLGLHRAAGARDPRPTEQVVAEASIEVRSGILYATAIIVLVFLPLFALSGIEGRLFAPLGIAFIVSILASLLVSMTVTPVLCYWLLPRMKSLVEHESPLVRVLKRWQKRGLEWSFERPAFVIGMPVAAVAVAVIGAVMLPRAFLPAFNEGTVLVGVSFQPGISLSESDRIGRIAENLVSEVPEVHSVGRRTGRAELDEHAEGVHTSEIDVDLRPSSRGREQVLADIRSRLSVLPASITVGQPIAHRLDHMLSGVRAQIALKIYGEDYDTLRSLAAMLEGRLKAIPGIVDLQTEKQVRIPELQVRIDYEKAKRYGLNPSTITSALETLSNGRVVSEIIDQQKRFDVVLRLSDADRTTRALSEMLIESPAGRIPISSVADVLETDGPNQIQRENGRRRIAVLANTDGSDMAGIVEAVRREIAQVTLPQGYFTSLEGQFQAQEEASRLIALLSVVSLTLIFVVLYTRYRSTALALIIMGNVPLAMIGSVAALWIAGQPFSVASAIGFITLAGIATRNGILKISHYINLTLFEGERFGRHMVVRGTLERLTPVLMTALAAGVALVPLMIGADEPGKELLHPVAITIFGGLVTATLLDAFLTPVLFLLFGRKPLERLAQEATKNVHAEAF